MVDAEKNNGKKSKRYEGNIAAHRKDKFWVEGGVRNKANKINKAY